MTEETTSTVDKINTIIDTALDPVTRDFEEHYIPNVSRPAYELAKAKMREILEGYNGKDNIPEDVMPFYKAWSYKVYSYSKDRMLENMENMDKRREKYNLASKILDLALTEGQQKLSASQIAAFYAMMERNEIIGTENLEILVKKSPETFANLCSYCETLLAREKETNIRMKPIIVYPSPKCGRWFDDLCSGR